MNPGLITSLQDYVKNNKGFVLWAKDDLALQQMLFYFFLSYILTNKILTNT